MEQKSGFAVVLKPEFFLEEFYQCHIVRDTTKAGILEYDTYLGQIRQTIKNIKPDCYRGTSRLTYDVSLSIFDGILRVEDGSARAAALRRIFEFFVENHPELCLGNALEDYNYNLLDTVEQAQNVREKMTDALQYEVTFLRRKEFCHNENTLGYDIGYWGGDNFSLICDSVILPVWHGPDKKDLSQLGMQLKNLNQHMLFNTPQEAGRFKDFYKTMAWAETEDYDGEFLIIQVDCVL